MTCRPSVTHAAFSLIELLVVISIIALLSSLAGLLLKSGGAQLSTSGGRIAGLMEQAREAAILKRQPTALVMITDGDDVGRRIFAVVGYKVDTMTGAGAWAQISKWENLPQGVLADDASGLDAFLPFKSPIVDPSLPVLSYGGKNYAPRDKYGYVVFLPDGSLYQDAAGSLPNPVVMRLVEGVREGGTLKYTSRQQGGKSVNFFEIALSQATGLVKITRP